MPIKLTNRETSLWAKKRFEDGKMLWLPLIVHLIDCTKVINWLFSYWLDAGQKKLLTNSTNDEDIQKLLFDLMKKEYSYSAVKKTHDCLSAVLKRAVIKEDITKKY